MSQQNLFCFVLLIWHKPANWCNLFAHLFYILYIALFAKLFSYWIFNYCVLFYGHIKYKYIICI